MLGRQQIADTATALTELWKNSYDAYATQSLSYHYADSGLLLLADDGMGMPYDTFVEKWLTLGTPSKSSKVPDERSVAFAKASGIAVRPVMGEKGIGRLALALLGDQAIAITRARNPDGQLETTTAWVAWNLFSVPSLMLEDIEIPISRTSGTPDLPATLRDLKSQQLSALHNLSSLKLDDASRSTLELVTEQVEAFPIESLHLFDSLDLPINHSTGTAFVVHPISRQMSDDVEDSLNSRGVSTDSMVDPARGKFFRLIRGFTDDLTISADRPHPNFHTNYLHVAGADDFGNLFEDELFSVDKWTVADLEATDHVFHGQFNELGHWDGHVSLYGDESMPVFVPNHRAQGHKTACGPFYITIGYLEGDRKNSRLDPEAHAWMKSRLDRGSGLYVYRDGIRVLPYGSFDVDFLGIEERRSKSAGRNYFSYRNMFGAISLSWEDNAALREKAGREGFRQDRSFRDFRHVINNVLAFLASEYLGTSARRKEESPVRDLQEEFQRRRRLASERDAQAAASRSAFARRLVEASAALDLARSRLDRISGDAIDAGANLGSEFDPLPWLSEIDDVVRSVSATPPAGVGLTGDLGLDYEEHSSRVHELIAIDVAAAREAVLTSATEVLGLQSPTDAMRSTIQDRFADLRNRADAAILSISAASRERIDGSQQQLLQATAELRPGDAQTASRLDLEGAFISIEELISDLEGVGEDIRSSRSLLAVEAARQEHIALLTGEADLNSELAQLGMAVAIVSHEFEASIRSVRDLLKRLRRWGDSNPQLATLTRDVSASFEHLDGYLRLFTPLQRRLHRAKSEIAGADIHNFIASLFDVRLSTADVTLRASDEFLRTQIYGYPSTFYPVFVNLIDNALHWISAEAESGTIELDATASTLTVTNDGPPIKVSQSESIFERGFTNKSTGRGLGLALARESLRSEGWRLTVDDSFREGARFVLTRPMNSEEHTE